MRWSVFFYIIWLLLYINNALIGSDGRHKDWQSSRPGFESQVFITFYVIFPYIIPCRFSASNYHTSLQSNVPRPLRDQSKGWDWRDILRASQRISMLAKKSNGSKSLLGQITGSIPHYWDFYPPWFAISFLFILFFSILIFIVLI